MSKIKIRVVRRFKLPSRIDRHRPVGVTFRVTGGDKPFRLTVITVNWGRGYDPGDFHRAVMDILQATEEMEYVVLLIQELDETDPAAEHVKVARMMEKGTTLVRWETREPIAVSPGVRVTRERKVMTMDQGTKINGPVGTGPRRFYVSCVTFIEGVTIGFGNQHPHRYSLSRYKGVREALERGEQIVKNEIEMLVEICDIVIDGGDLNTTRYPRQHPRQLIANKDGYDHIRYIDKRRS